MQWKNKIIPDPPNSIGRISSPKDSPVGTGLESKILDEAGILCDYDDEIYYKIFQVIQYIEDKDYAFRIAYWRYNEKKGNWVWGQFTQMISPEEWDELYQKAKDKGFFDKYKN